MVRTLVEITSVIGRYSDPSDTRGATASPRMPTLVGFVTDFHHCTDAFGVPSMVYWPYAFSGSVVSDPRSRTVYTSTGPTHGRRDATCSSVVRYFCCCA